MDYPGGVRRRECCRDLFGDGQRFAHTEWPPRDSLAQGDAVDVFHRDKVATIFCFGDFVNYADIGMAQRRSCARLLFEPAHPMEISGEIGRKKFKRYPATQPFVLGKIDFAHAADTERREDLVRTNLLVGQQSRETVGKEFGGYFVGRSVEKVPVALVCEQERFHFVLQVFVIAALLTQKVCALRQRPFQRRVEELIYLLPPFRFHDELSVSGFGAYLFEVL